MRPLAIAAVLGLVVPAFSIPKYTLSHDSIFDDGESSLNNFTCATGEHGLCTRGFKNLGDLPTWPNVGSAPQIMSSNSSYCGSCWHLTYTDASGQHKSVNFTAVHGGSNSPDDFATSMKAWKSLTDGKGDKGKDPKTVPITAARKHPSWCGLEG